MLTKFTGAIDTIQGLADKPNQDNGLTPAQLKLKFDQHAINTKEYLDVLTGELDGVLYMPGGTTAEVIEARKGEPSLSTKIGKIDLSLAENMQETSVVKNKAIKPTIGKWKTVTDDNSYNGWPIIIKTIANRLLVFYSTGEQHYTPFYGRKVVFKYSDDYGLNWSDEITLKYNEDLDWQINSAIALSNGDIVTILAFINEAMQTDYIVLRSTDNGITWNETFKFSNSLNADLHKVGIINIPIELESGKIIASRKYFDSNGWLGCSAIISEDNGYTFTRETIIKTPEAIGNLNSPNEVRLCYLGEGKIIGIGRIDNSSNVFQIESSDYGETWTAIKSNIWDCYNDCASIIYFDSTITIYYYDRYTNAIRKRSVHKDYIFNKPTKWPDSEVVSYCGSPANPIDSGYTSTVRLRDDRDETITAIYTGNNNGKTSINIVYDTIYDKNTGWIPLTFQNGWENIGGSISYYKKTDDIVTVILQITNATPQGSKVMFNLPTGFRPSLGYSQEILTEDASTAKMIRVNIGTDGNVTTSGVSKFIPLTNIYAKFDFLIL